MNYFNKEQMEFLSKYEDVFETSVFGNFKHSTNILTDKKIGDMYTKVTGETLGPWSCNTCNLNNYIAIGKLYYATKKYFETIANEKENENNRTEKQRTESDDSTTKNSSAIRSRKKRDVKGKKQ